MAVPLTLRFRVFPLSVPSIIMTDESEQGWKSTLQRREIPRCQQERSCLHDLDLMEGRVGVGCPFVVLYGPLWSPRTSTSSLFRPLSLIYLGHRANNEKQAKWEQAKEYDVLKSDCKEIPQPERK